MRRDTKIYIWLIIAITQLNDFCRANPSWYKEFNGREMNLTDCLSYNNKRKPLFPAPVFSTSNGENLSFEDCGTWVNNEGDPWNKWTVSFDRENCTGLILSQKTVISFAGGYCNKIYAEIVVRGREELEERSIDIFGGNCVDEEDLATCYQKRGLLSQKVRDVEKIKIKLGAFNWKSIYVWLIDKISFTPNMQPACLWNRDNQNDVAERFYYYSDRLGKFILANLSPEESCYQGTIREWKCDLYSNSICLFYNEEKPIDSVEFLFITRGSRLYLRGLTSVVLDRNKSSFLDLLPFIRKIVTSSRDLTLMPEIPALKNKIDFGPGQSFEDCGRPVGRRSKRDDEEDDEDDDKLPGAITSLIVGGENAVRGRHPWHASLSLVTDTGVDNDVCGASLISEKTLVTAAHCLFNPTLATLVPSSDVKVVLGMHDRIKELEDSRQKLKVSQLFVHPGYDHRRHKDDIALITLEKKVIITNFVRPICLWNLDFDLKKIVNKIGTVVGWGYTSEHRQADTLKKADLKIESYEECYESKKSFFSVNMRPRQNFCAGYPQNKTSACRGDSGGGFSYFDRESERHFLRGVVSTGHVKRVNVDDVSLITCNPNYYSLFTDVTYYMQWIVDNMK